MFKTHVTKMLKNEKFMCHFAVINFAVTFLGFISVYFTHYNFFYICISFILRCYIILNPFG